MSLQLLDLSCGCDDIHIPLFASVLDRAEEEVKYSFDIDGVVFWCLMFPASKLNYTTFLWGTGWIKGVQSLAPIKETPESAASTQRMGSVHSISQWARFLALVDGGYFLNLTCVPANPDRAHPMLKDELIVKAHTMGLLNAVYKSLVTV